MSTNDSKNTISTAIISGIFLVIAAIISGLFLVQANNVKEQTSVTLTFAFDRLRLPTYTPYPTYTIQPSYTFLPIQTSTSSFPIKTTDTVPLPVKLSSTVTIPPSPTSNSNTVSGTTLNVGDTWVSQGLSLTLEKVEWRPDSAWIGVVDFWFYLKNNSGQKILLSFDKSNFEVKDNLGTTYGSKCLTQDPYSSVIEAGKGIYLEDGCTPYDSVMFTGNFFNKSVTQITIFVKDVARISQAKWIVQVPH